MQELFKKPVFIVGVVGIAISLFFSFSTSSSMTVNGEVVQSTFRDYPSIIGGGIAAVCGVLLAPGALKKRARGEVIAVAVLVLIGALRVVMGLGLVS